MKRSQPRTRSEIRRILVGLDASPSSYAALEAAVSLALDLEAEIEGLFVEDVNLLRFAGLSFTRVVDAASARPRAFEPADIERELRARAEQARQMLAAAAGTRISWSFRVARGKVESEFLAAARKADLVSLGFVGDRPAGGTAAGSLARRAVFDSSRSVLLLRRRQSAGAPVALCLDKGPKGVRALDCAASLAKAQGGPLTVVTFAATKTEERRIEARVADRLHGLNLRFSFLHLGAAGRRDLDAVLRAAHGGVLVVSAESPLVEGDTLRTLVENCACSLLLAR
ncbi:MAG: universal stress protein [Proteobacteria bacterium]|nr:universal stress protein [Pseudomonadota bacterium]